jgi:putative transposase
MNLIRTEQIRINKTKELSSLCHLSKNLYNEANYLVREAYFLNENKVKYNELDAWLKLNSENYKSLNAQSAQQILRLLEKDWNSFYESKDSKYKNPSKFKGKVKFPGYKPKDGEAILIFTNQQVSIKDHILTFPKKLPLKIKTRLQNNTDLREVRIIPNSNHYIVEIVYSKINEEGIINKRWYAKNNNIIGIDLGLRNIITIANNIGQKPIVIKGGILKSINQFYNKQKALLQSIYDKQNIKYGFKMQSLTLKHNAKIKDIMHKYSRFIIDYVIKHNIGTIVIGKNGNWKQDANMGKKNNQNFVQIPHTTLIQQIQYKAEEYGIKVILTEESYTSKCSFLDLEPIQHHDSYIGIRNKGLFFPNSRIPYNSDVNGALNIIRKAIPNAFINIDTKGIEDVVLHPERFNPL